MERTAEDVLEETETWALEYSYGSPGLSLGGSYTPCNSLDECRAQLAYMEGRCGRPLWARAVHTTQRTLLITTIYGLVEPREEP